jgi:hypothetical protein
VYSGWANSVTTESNTRAPRRRWSRGRAQGREEKEHGATTR